MFSTGLVFETATSLALGYRCNITDIIINRVEHTNHLIFQEQISAHENFYLVKKKTKFLRHNSGK